jgi:cytochrome c oxidase subunit 2
LLLSQYIPHGIESCLIWLKVANINAIRAKKSIDLVAKGGTDLILILIIYFVIKYVGFHYNMQMKIIVDTPEDYKNWLKEN